MIDVLLVDDEALTLELHRSYLARMPGFRVVAECSGARAAVAALLDPDLAVDLVLLDMTMPDGTGIDVLRHVRARGVAVDVIAVTAVRDAEAVHAMAALGVTQYLVKPFAFAAFAERLEHHRAYRERTAVAAGPATQAEIDALLGASRPAVTPDLPKGLAPDTLERVIEALRAGVGGSASEVGERLGMSRVAARRYLEHLVESGRADREARYGRTGRPETEYRWRR